MRAKTLSASQRCRISCSRAGRSTWGGSAAKGAGRAHGVHSPRTRQTSSACPGRGGRGTEDCAPWGAAAGEHHGHRRARRRGPRRAGRGRRPAAGRPARPAQPAALPRPRRRRWGRAGSGVQFENFALTQTLGVAALVVILAEGGLTTRWTDVRRAIGPGLSAGHGRASPSASWSPPPSRSGCWTSRWGFALLLGAVDQLHRRGRRLRHPAPAAAAAAAWPRRWRRRAGSTTPR